MTLDPGTTGANPEGGSAVEWTFDPWHERPRTAVVAGLAVLAFWAVILTSRLPQLLELALGAMASLSLLPAIVPAACRAAEDGATRSMLLSLSRRGWGDVRRVEDVPVGVLLSPFAERHWLDATRALTLPMPAARRTELRSHVRRLWGAHGR